MSNHFVVKCTESKMDSEYTGEYADPDFIGSSIYKTKQPLKGVMCPNKCPSVMSYDGFITIRTHDGLSYASAILVTYDVAIYGMPLNATKDYADPTANGTRWRNVNISKFRERLEVGVEDKIHYIEGKRTVFIPCQNETRVFAARRGPNSEDMTLMITDLVFPKNRDFTRELAHRSAFLYIGHHSEVLAQLIDGYSVTGCSTEQDLVDRSEHENHSMFLDMLNTAIDYR